MLLAFASYATYAMSDASVRLLHGRIPPFELVFFGAVLGLVALPLVRRPGECWRDMLRAHDRRLWFLRSAMAVAGSVTSVIAFTMLSMPEAFALIFLLPAFVTLLSVLFLGEQVGWRRWSAVGIGFLGVLIVLRPGFRALGWGHLSAIAAGLAGAVTIVLLRAMGKTETRLSLYGAGLLGPILGGAILMAPDFVRPSARDAGFVVSYGLLAAAGNALLMVASAKAPASLVAPPQYSQMLWAIALGLLLFHEAPDTLTLVGACVIIGSGLFTLSREQTKRPRRWDRNPPIHPQ